MSGFGSPDDSADPKPAPGPKAKEPKEPKDKSDYTGTPLLVTWGKEHIQPLRFQGMDLGPFAMTVVIEEGETPLAAMRRAMRQMNAMAEEQLAEKMPRFVQRCKDAEDFR